MDNSPTHRPKVPAATSRAIDLLRFPLIVGVVFIHAFFTPEALPEAGEESLPIYHLVVNFCSRLIPMVCVPLFFLFSGYLFYFGVKDFTTPLYLKRLRSRFRSLLIPYLFWNLLLYVTVIVLRGYVRINYLSVDVPFPLNMWNAGTDPGEMGWPLAGQFWFIRDLIVCVVISPLLYWVIYHTRHFGILLLAAAWIIGWEIPVVWRIGASMTALFFFSLGGWAARYRGDMAAAAWDLRFFGILWPVLIVMQLVDIDGVAGKILWNLMILSGIVFMMCLARWLVTDRSVKAVPLLAASSFFIFAFHSHWGLSPLRRLLFAIFHPHTDMAYTAIYLTHIVLTVVLGVLIYYLLSRMFPRATSFITGGR